MVVQKFTLPQFQEYLNALPSKVQRNSSEVNLAMAKSLQRRMLLRLNPTGFFSTGNLKKNIVVKAVGDKKAQIVGPYYWKYINLGIGPKGAIPLEFLEQHLTNPNNPGQPVAEPTWVNTDENPLSWDANKGFVDNAIQTFDKDATNIINKAITKMFTK